VPGVPKGPRAAKDGRKPDSSATAHRSVRERANSELKRSNAKGALAAARPDFTILVKRRHRSCARLVNFFEFKHLAPRLPRIFARRIVAANLKNGVTGIGETRCGVLHHVHQIEDSAPAASRIFLSISAKTSQLLSISDHL
jgi:hypothetical protein